MVATTFREKLQQRVERLEKRARGQYDRRLIKVFEKGIEEFQQEPEKYFIDVLGLTGRRRLDKYQLKVANAVRDHDQVDVKCGNEVGKTYGFAAIIHWFVICFGPYCSVITTASTDRQLKGQLWVEIKNFFYGAKYQLPGRMLEKYWELDRELKWFAIGFSTKVEENFEGWHNLNQLLVMDEAKGIPDPVWIAGRRLQRGEEGVKKWLAGGTPPLAPIGEFCQISLDPRKADKWHHIHWSGWDSSRVSNKKCQEDKETYGENSPFYKSMVEGEIPLETEETIINIMDVEAAAGRDVPAGKDIRLGVDVSRAGSDETVVTIRYGYRCEQYVHKNLHRGSKKDQNKDRTTWLLGRLKLLLQPFPHPKRIPIFIDEGSMGGGVVDDLMLEGYNVVPINFGWAPLDPQHFFDWGTEMYATLGKVFAEGKVSIPNDALLKAQLWTRTKLYWRKKGQKYGVVGKILSKKEFCSHPEFRGIRSPDRADSLALAWSEYPPLDENLRKKKVGGRSPIRGAHAMGK